MNRFNAKLIWVAMVFFWTMPFDATAQWLERGWIRGGGGALSWQTQGSGIVETQCREFNELLEAFGELALTGSCGGDDSGTIWDVAFGAEIVNGPAGAFAVEAGGLFPPDVRLEGVVDVSGIPGNALSVESSVRAKMFTVAGQYSIQIGRTDLIGFAGFSAWTADFGASFVGIGFFDDLSLDEAVFVQESGVAPLLGGGICVRVVGRVDVCGTGAWTKLEEASMAPGEAGVDFSMGIVTADVRIKLWDRR